MGADSEDGPGAGHIIDESVDSARLGKPPDEQARALLQSFSLTESEAKTLVALVGLGSALPNQLVPVTGIGRTNVYRVLESLQQKQLAQKTAGRNSVWVAADSEEIAWRLRQREEERFRAAKEALEQVRAALEAIPKAKERATAVFEVTDEAAITYRYGEAVSTAAEELLVFNRGPYAGDVEVDERVLAALDRGVKARAIWQASEVSGSGTEEVRRCAFDYATAGVETRVVDQLPLKLAVIDRRLTLLVVPGGHEDDMAYVASVVVENETYAQVMAGVFEQCWAQAEPMADAARKVVTG